MLIVMPLWLWVCLLPLVIAWRVTMWSIRLTLVATRRAIDTGGMR